MTAKILTRDDILKAEDRKIQPLHIPEWGGTIYLREWSAKDMDTFEKSQQKADEHNSKKRALLAALSVCDAEGNKMFSVDDIEQLGEKSTDALDRVLLAVVLMNGWDQESQEELEKN